MQAPEVLIAQPLRAFVATAVANPSQLGDLDEHIGF